MIMKRIVWRKSYKGIGEPWCSAYQLNGLKKFAYFSRICALK